MLVDVGAVRSGGDPEANRKEPIYEEIEVPEEFGPVAMVVEENAVKAYAFSVDAPVARGDDGRVPRGSVAPVGLLLNELLQLFTLRYAASRVVGLHTEESARFMSPARVGERVTLHGRYVEKFIRRGQGCVVMEASARGEDGRSLLHHRGVEIMRARPGAIGGRGSVVVARGDRRRVTTEVREGTEPVSLVSAELAVDTPLAPVVKRITQAQMAVFSRAGEWVRNIHNDLTKARNAGLAAPIVQGQQLFALTSEYLASVLGPSFSVRGELTMKFLRPVAAFEQVEIAGATRSAAGEEPDLDVWLRDGSSCVVAVGWARCASTVR